MIAASAVISAPPSSAFILPPFDTASLSRPPSLSFAANEGGSEDQSSTNEAPANVNSDSSSINATKSFRFPNPLTELADMFTNFDDIVDDFFNKRVSNPLALVNSPS